MATQRLRLRPVGADDAGRIAELAGDWDVASMTARMPYPYTLHDAHQWIDGLDEREFVRAVECQGELIGVVGFVPSDVMRSAEIGYWLGKPYWGAGYATEAAAAMVAYCFRRRGFRAVTCAHLTDNPASARVIAKLGFVATGVERTWCEARRRDVEVVRYELSRPQPSWWRLGAA
ncbi:MAG: GNAT family N-acetyltransferase [Hyphomicrobiaceae bacterium]|nr:GNAT family N-acetyltransferase [Hyphomicrobiaceae bacterium]